MLFLPVLLLISLVAASPVAPGECLLDDFCIVDNEVINNHVGDLCRGSSTILSTQYIGENKNVKLELITCDALTTSNATQNGALLQARQIPNVCGANCATHCFTPSGGGPDPNECHVIADALRFDSQNIDQIFTVSNGSANILSLTYYSCTSFFLNQAATPLNYCRTDFAALIDWLAPNCQATQNAHGGLCVANDGRWFVQVQHS